MDKSAVSSGSKSIISLPALGRLSRWMRKLLFLSWTREQILPLILVGQNQSVRNLRLVTLVLTAQSHWLNTCLEDLDRFSLLNYETSNLGNWRPVGWVGVERQRWAIYDPSESTKRTTWSTSKYEKEIGHRRRTDHSQTFDLRSTLGNSILGPAIRRTSLARNLLPPHICIIQILVRHTSMSYVS